MEDKLKEAVSRFDEAIEAARGNSLIKYLDEYQTFISKGVEQGNFTGAIYHADLLATYFVDANPWKTEENKEIDHLKEENPVLYEVKDAGRKMWDVGIAAQEIAEELRRKI